MELFSEIYSCYYNVVAKILTCSINNCLSKDEINKIIQDNGFSESAFYILPKLISGEWNLLNKTESGFISKINNPAGFNITNLEKAWLKAVLSDKRIKLFLDDSQIVLLNEYLEDIQPLFSLNDFYCFDAFSDGDDYSNKDYIANFKEIMHAVKNKVPLNISFESGKTQRITGNYLPCQIQYSNKDDKFRVYGFRIKNGNATASAIINIGRIQKISPSKETINLSFNYMELLNKLLFNSKRSEPLTIEISKERNALERCMLHFANFDKHTEYDKETDKYICYIHYNKLDETELLIRVLSFGPVIKVLGPDSFLLLLRERVKKQHELLSYSAPK